jgi:hypothetical protein
MKKLQLFIIISSVLLASYTCAGNFLIIPDVDSFCVDFDYSRQCAMTGANRSHNSPDLTFLIAECFDHPSFSVGDETADIQSDIDIDIPEGPEMNDLEVTLMSSAFEGFPVFTARCSAMEIFHFPPEAYRLRI